MSEPTEITSSSRIWRMLRSKISCSIFFSLLGVAGMLLIVGGFTTGLEATNSIEFCTSCHDMSYNYEEYKKTTHYANPAGVRAVCSDCHVPKRNWFIEMQRKLEASHDVWAELMGAIDTREKFDAHRMEMAKREWARMKESDSIGCRNCHTFEAMDIEAQAKGARSQHTQASMKESGKTCIDCHKGIAHKLPRVQ
jgi:cytochrome c-type protein NapC